MTKESVQELLDPLGFTLKHVIENGNDSWLIVSKDDILVAGMTTGRTDSINNIRLDLPVYWWHLRHKNLDGLLGTVFKSEEFMCYSKEKILTCMVKNPYCNCKSLEEAMIRKDLLECS